MRPDTKIYMLTIIGLLVSSGSAFNSVGKTKIPHSWSLSATNDRRNFISSAFLAVTTVSITNAQPASATYSAYTNREKDWQERQKSGDVKFSSARDLKAQLREIAPMNSESSKSSLDITLMI